VRALFRAFAERDVQAALAVAHPGLEFWPQGTAENVGRQEPYRGHEGLREYFDDVARAWRDLVVEPGELRAVAGAVVAFGSAHGVRADGTQLDLPVIWTFKIRDGLVLCGRVVGTAAEAHEALREAG
jgi:ketosteroid isomerase-like protein